jgi:hypothetical protein
MRVRISLILFCLFHHPMELVFIFLICSSFAGYMPFRDQGVPSVHLLVFFKVMLLLYKILSI